jgi:hypothetical protein
MDVRTLSRVLTSALKRLEDDLLASTDPEETRRTASALATMAGVYAKVTEAHAFEEEIAKLRQEINDATERLGRPQSSGPDADAPRVN